MSHYTTKLEKGREEFEKKFDDMLDLVESRLGFSERKSTADFLTSFAQSIHSATIDDCLEALPEGIGKEGVLNDEDMYTAYGHNVCLTTSREKLLALKK